MLVQIGDEVAATQSLVRVFADPDAAREISPMIQRAISITDQQNRRARIELWSECHERRTTSAIGRRRQGSTSARVRAVTRTFALERRC